MIGWAPLGVCLSNMLFACPVEPVSELAYIERCLICGEKLLDPIQKLKDAGKNPGSTLKRIRDIGSPLAIAVREASRSDKRQNDAASAYLLLSKASVRMAVMVVKFPDVTSRTIFKTGDGKAKEGENVDHSVGTPTSTARIASAVTCIV